MRPSYRFSERPWRHPHFYAACTAVMYMRLETDYKVTQLLSQARIPREVKSKRVHILVNQPAVAVMTVLA